jgi:hypothetical protein
MGLVLLLGWISHWDIGDAWRLIVFVIGFVCAGYVVLTSLVGFAVAVGKLVRKRRT